MNKIGIKGFVIGTIIGFGFGVYHGYDYATEQYKKELKYSKTVYEQPINNLQKNRLEEMIKEEGVNFKYHKNKI